MLAMVLDQPGHPLRAIQIPVPEPDAGQIRIKVHTCGVCRTDLHIVDSELKHPRLPLVPGHEIVGVVDKLGTGADRFQIGDRVGVPWLGWTCGECKYCRNNRENLCDNARFTGYDINGGYAEYTVADQRYCFCIPGGYPDIQAAPLLCAGLIGYRSLRMIDGADPLGLYGFGASAHIVAQIAKYQGRRVYAFTKSGDKSGQVFALNLGADWAGGSDQTPPGKLQGSIIFAPVGELVPQSLRITEKGGVVVCAGIHMSDIPSFPYSILWGERSIKSVANLTRRDGEELLDIAPKVPVKTHCETYPLIKANEALDDLRSGSLTGAAVLIVSQ